MKTGLPQFRQACFLMLSMGVESSDDAQELAREMVEVGAFDEMGIDGLELGIAGAVSVARFRANGFIVKGDGDDLCAAALDLTHDVGGVCD